MKRILRFLSLVNNIDRTLAYVRKALCNYMAIDILYIVFNSIMPVKSQRFNTKIYIFERYSTWCSSYIDINTLEFMSNRIVLKPILQKK